jgi:hypothetical protein
MKSFAKLRPELPHLDLLQPKKCSFGSVCCAENVPFTSNDAFTKRWEQVLVCLLLYTTFLTTWEVAFANSTGFKVDFLFCLNRLVDFGFACDMWVNFNTSFVNDDNVTVRDRTKVKANYLHGWFILDLVSMIPFGLLGDLMGSDDVTEMASFRLIRLLRFMKLIRLIRASRLITPLIMKSNLLMRQWSFIKTFFMMLTLFHWSVCGLMVLTSLEEADPNWLSIVELRNKQLQEDIPGFIATSRYLEASKYTLAVFGVWSFEPPEMMTTVEKWYTVLMTVFAASFYAYLAGVVVELVQRMSEATQDVNRKLDGVMEYLNCVKYPKSGREIYKKFFWDCKAYFLHEYYLESLPHLSPELNGKLAYFQYGKQFDSVPFFKCRSEVQRDEAIRFQALASDKLAMKAFVQEEQIIIEALYLVCAGLIGYAGRVCRKGSSLGHMQVLDERQAPDKASAMTFVMCMTLQAEEMW